MSGPGGRRDLGLRLRLAGRAPVALDLVLHAVPGEVTAVFGRSGAGKTTLLRTVAGLERREGAEVAFRGETWQARGRWVPPHRRTAAVVFQDAALPPARTLGRALAWTARRASGEAWRPRSRLVDALGLGPLLDRVPATLSGGERQRAALALALVRAPALLLLDEPLSALDDPARRRVGALIRAWVRERGGTALLVSHDLSEVARLADRMAWLEEGRVRALGTPDAVAADPDFLRWRGDEAVSLVAGTIAGHDPRWDLVRVDTVWGELLLRGGEASLPAGTRVLVRVAAGDVSLGRGTETDSTILNQLPARIASLDDAGPGELLVRLAPPGGEAPPLAARITKRSADALELACGQRVVARVKGVALMD